MAIALPSLQVIELRGLDAVAFAHAQFSSDVRTQYNGQWQFSTWLSPQGRVRAFFHLLRDADDRLRMVLRGGNPGEVAAALTRFIFRSKVELRVLEDIQVFGCTQAQAIAECCGDVAQGTTTTGNVQHTSLCIQGETSRWLLLLDAGSSKPSSTEPGMDRNQWRLADIRAGLPELAPALQEQLLPQWLGLDRLGAISVNKGCYPGQEIIARLHFKGGNKRSLYLVEFDGVGPPEANAHLVSCDERQESAGRIVMAAQSAENRIVALAALHDELAKACLRFTDSPGREIGARIRFD
ncbi:MAG: folate-binding protein [Rudaea sp.]